ncbi:MAG: hypothetical protein BZ135_04210 [Methanosphaera sp. rholeuAM6]|nr:MAG: hypothetical protein BZ135_04210 [Methanosphaera sp. rholeuAM6]
MNDGSKPPITSGKLIILLLVAIIVIMLVTVALNGGTSAPEVEKSNDTVESETQVANDYKLLGNNSYGVVTKSSGYGNPNSDIHIAFILGVDAKRKAQNSIVPTLQNEDGLNYCYDVYLVDATGGVDNQTNLTINDMSESLAAEYVVPDVVKNNYNFTVDVHSTNDSNSYVFVPSEDTYTSKKVLDSITNSTKVGAYTPSSPSYTDSVSKPIISYEIPSIVYVTRDYYSNSSSAEVSSIISAIDNFDFMGLFNSDSNTSNETVATVSGNSSGNQEVN